MHFVAVTIEKNANGKVGLAFADDAGKGSVVITKIGEGSPFAETDITEGMTILTVNSIACDRLTATQVKALLALLPDSITMIASELSEGIQAQDIQLITAEKNPDGRLGISIVDTLEGAVVVTDVADDSPFRATALTKDMSILTINNISCDGMDAKQVKSILSSVDGSISLFAGTLKAGPPPTSPIAKLSLEPVVVTADKSEDGKVGLSFVDQTDGTVTITKISETSPFANTDIQVGMAILTINTISCHSFHANQVKATLTSLESPITLIAAMPSPTTSGIKVQDVHVGTVESSEGLDFADAENGTVVIAEISPPDSPLTANLVKEGMSVLTINSVSCAGMNAKQVKTACAGIVGPLTLFAGTLSATTTTTTTDGESSPPPALKAKMHFSAATVEKNDGKIGVVFSDAGNGSVVIAKIKDDSPFAKTAMASGMTVVCVNGISCQGMDAKAIKSVVSTLPSTITVVAAKFAPDVWPTIKLQNMQVVTAEKNAEGKVGLSFVDKKDGMIVVSKVAETSPFASTGIAKDMTIFSVNNITCLGMGATKLRDVLGSLPGAIDLIVGNISESFGEAGPPMDATFEPVVATAEKKTNGKIGVSFVDNADGSAVIITKVSEDSPFAGTGVEKDMTILTLNGISCHNLSANQVASIIASLENSVIMIAAKMDRGVQAKNVQSVSVSKNEKGKVGLSMVDMKSGTVVITKMAEDSPFANTAIKEGMSILSVNGISCVGMDAVQVKAIFSSVPEPVTLFAGTLTGASAGGGTSDSLLKMHRYARVSKQFVAVTVYKNKDGKVGLSFGDTGDGSATIKKISETSPFAKTAISEGMTVLTINTIACKNIDAKMIAALLKMLPDTITMIAAKLSPGIIAKNIQVATVEKNESGDIGIEFQDGENGSVVIAKIADDGPFASTSLVEGMSILTLNNVTCDCMDAEQLKAIFAKTRGSVVTLFCWYIEW